MSNKIITFVLLVLLYPEYILGTKQSDWTVLSWSSILEINNISFDQEKMPQIQALSMGIESVKTNKMLPLKRFFGNLQTLIVRTNAEVLVNRVAGTSNC
jgi:hypothetical protein